MLYQQLCMAKKYKYKNFCNIDYKERVVRAVWAVVFFIISWYIWYTLLVNKFGSWNKVVLIIPLYFAFLTAYEAAIGHCVLKDKVSRKSGLIHLLSITSAVVVSVILVFI